MFRKVLGSKIHGATITETNLDYVGSITLNKKMIEEAGMIPFEEVHVWNLTNGERLTTYLIPEDGNENCVRLNGSAARKAMVGDRVIIVSYRYIEESTKEYSCKVLMLDSENKLKEKFQYKIDLQKGETELIKS